MTSPSRSLRRAACALAVVAATAVACESPTESRDIGVFPLGPTLEGRVAAAGETVTYALPVPKGTLFLVYLDALDDALTLRIIDPRGQEVGWASHPGTVRRWGPPSQTLVTAAVGGEYLVRVSAPSGSRGGGFVLRPTLVNSAPELLPAAARLSDTVSGETIGHQADVDDFTFDAQAGQELNVFLQKLDADSGYLYAEVSPVSSSVVPTPIFPIATAVGAGAGEDLEMGASSRFAVRTTGRHRVRVLTNPVHRAGPYIGAYRLRIYAVQRAPERAPAALTAGDTLSGEAIDHVGDVDEFTVSAAPGTAFNLFAEAGAGLHTLIAAVTTGDGTYGPDRTGYARPGERLLESPTGTFVIPASGRATVTVSDDRSDGGLFRGPYRLYLYQIDPRPEAGSAEIVPSRTPFSGTIDQYGDVDEYQFTLTSPQLVALRVDPAVAAKLSVSLAGGPWLDAGTHRVRVTATGGGARGSYRGPYRFALAAVGSAPENAPPTLAVGSTVSLETTAWPQDIDSFQLSSATADTVQLVLTRPTGDGTWTRTLSVTDAAGGWSIFPWALLWYGDSIVVPRLDLMPGRRYMVNIAGSTEQWLPGTSVPFRLDARRVSAAPEHRAAEIAFGDTVRDSLDFYGDIDDYVLRGTPGQELTVVGAWRGGNGPGSFALALIDPATGAKLPSVGFWSLGYSPTVTIPAGGAVRVRACVEADCVSPPTHPLVTYWLVVHAIDRAPEKVPARFAVGDTVSGEDLHQPRDIDELTFDGTAGQRVSVYFQLLTISGYLNAPGLSLELVDVATGQVLGTLGAARKTSRLEDIALAPITLPRTGAYLVRVRAVPEPTYSGDVMYGAYRLRVAPAP